MRCIILGAGQGRRLLPLTAELPKCALQIGSRSLVEWQIAQLMQCGVDRVTVIVGFGAEKVEQLLRSFGRSNQVTALYNPFFAVSDNLVSCWLARHLMTEDFILLNGDTLFETTALERLLDAPDRPPVTLVTDRKLTYDADDMKVMVEGRKLLRVGKTLSPEQSHGESIGMLLFRGSGPSLLADAIDRAMRKPDALRCWYLSVIDEMAQEGLVWTYPVQGTWTEVDCLADLEDARRLVASWTVNSAHPASFAETCSQQSSQPASNRRRYPRQMPPQEMGA